MECALGAGRGLLAEHLVVKEDHGSYAALMWLLRLGHMMHFSAAYLLR
jgi:hypothetical protein